MSRFITVGRKLDLKFGDDINSNFTKTDSELTRIESERKLEDDLLQEDVNTKNSNAHSRITQVEQDRITKDTQIEALIGTKETESIGRDNDLQGQINTIVSVPNDGNAEITLARQGRSTLAVFTKEIDDKLKAQNKQTSTIGHGTSIINSSSDVSSTIKVEIYGNTISNIITNGSFENLDGWSLGGSMLSTLDNIIKKYGNNSVKFNNSSGTSYSYKDNINLDSSKYYILIVDAYIQSYTSGQNPRFMISDSGGFVNLSNIDFDITKLNQWQTKYIKITGKTSLRLTVGNTSSSTSIWNADGVRLISVSADTYNKIGDLSLLGNGADVKFVETNYPYVNSIGFVERPYFKASGKNVTPLLNEWERGSIGSSNGINSTSTARVRTVGFVQTNYQTFYISVSGTYEVIVFYYDENDNFIGINGGWVQEVVVSNQHKIRLILRLRDDSNIYTSDVEKANMFIYSNPSYLYAECTLAGNDNKKDILKEVDVNGKTIWQLEDWFEKNKALDGTLPWSYVTTGTGYKKVKVNITNAINHSQEIEKFDGNILKKFQSTGSIADEGYIYNNELFISVSDADATGFDLTTSTGIKAFFQAKADAGTPYKLTYQRVTPIKTDVSSLVEGSLKVNGATQITVGSEFTYTETDGVKTYTITPSNQRTGANLTEVKATYDTSMASAFASAVTKLSDVETNVSINKSSIVEIYAILKANNLI